MVIPADLPALVAPVAWMLGTWEGWGMYAAPAAPGQEEPSEDSPVVEEIRGDVVGERHLLVSRTEDEFARVQNEGPLGGDVDEACELRLVGRRIDDRILVVVEEPEETVEVDVDARRLDHLRVPRFQADPAGIDAGANVAVGEKHDSRVSKEPARRSLAAPRVSVRYRRRRGKRASGGAASRSI